MADTVRIQGIAGVFIYANDADSLARWYRDTLDIETEHYGSAWFCEWPSADRFPGGGRVATIHFAIFQAEGQLTGAKSARLGFRVHDLDRTCALLEARGQTVERKPQQADYGRFAWVSDPEGNKIELWEPPPAGTTPPT